MFYRGIIRQFFSRSTGWASGGLRGTHPVLAGKLEGGGCPLPVLAPDGARRAWGVAGTSDDSTRRDWTRGEFVPRSRSGFRGLGRGSWL